MGLRYMQCSQVTMDLILVKRLFFGIIWLLTPWIQFRLKIDELRRIVHHFLHFSCRIIIQNDWINPLGENGGQTLLGQHRPSLPSCFGSNEMGFEPFVTAETGGRAWPMVPKTVCPPFSPSGSFCKSYTGTPITLFFGPGEIYHIIGKTVLKEEGFSSKWVNWAVKNARVR